MLPEEVLEEAISEVQPATRRTAPTNPIETMDEFDVEDDDDSEDDDDDFPIFLQNKNF